MTATRIPASRTASDTAGVAHPCHNLNQSAPAARAASAHAGSSRKARIATSFDKRRVVSISAILRSPMSARRIASHCATSEMICAICPSWLSLMSNRIPKGSDAPKASPSVTMLGSRLRNVARSRSDTARGSPQSRERSGSWTQTGTPSRVNRTSVSMASTPAAAAVLKAEMLFSAASAAPPRWAIASGRRSGERIHKPMAIHSPIESSTNSIGLTIGFKRPLHQSLFRSELDEH